MSRGQQGQVFNTGQGENATYNTDAQTSFKTAQGDIGTFANEVGAFNAANPYGQGGQAQTAENQATADTAAGLAQSSGQALQGQAVRTGQNTGGAIAATKSMEAANDRALVGQEAGETQARLAAGTGYQETGLKAQEAIPGMEDTVAQQQAAAAQGALGSEEQAAQTPSFMDELGQGLISAGPGFAQGFGQGFGQSKGCWVAAAVWDEDFFTGPKTNLVREWLWSEWVQNWYAPLILKLYSKIGKWVSQQPMLVKMLRPLFEAAYRKAVNSDGR